MIDGLLNVTGKDWRVAEQRAETGMEEESFGGLGYKREKEAKLSLKDGIWETRMLKT